MKITNRSPLSPRGCANKAAEVRSTIHTKTDPNTATITTADPIDHKLKPTS